MTGGQPFGVDRAAPEPGIKTKETQDAQNIFLKARFGIADETHLTRA